MRIKQLKPKMIWKKRMLLTLFIVFGLIIAGGIFWNFSPIPKAFLIKKAFEGGMFVQSNNYKNALKKRHELLKISIIILNFLMVH